MTTARPHPGSAGFTLLEVMISLLLLSMGITTVFGAMGSASQCATNGKLRDLAITQMQREIEDAQSCLWTQISSVYNSAAAPRTFNVTGLTPPAGRATVGTATLQSSAAVTSQYVVRFECRWVGASGEPASAIIDYVAANQGR